jgi:CheY-like chemotaxis protein
MVDPGKPRSVASDHMSKEQASILVVDDDPEIVAMLTTRLGHRGYKVLTASDGHRALELAKREKPALVLLDVMMPGKSGWEVARALKQDPVTQGIKIVMVTAIGEQVNELTSPLYGADAHIDKPFEFEKLEKVIRGLVTDH